MRVAGAAVLLTLHGCAAATGATAPPEARPSVIHVAPASTSPTTEGAELPPAERHDPPTPDQDPFEYYVGKWRGTVNAAIATELVVLRSGAFVVVSQGNQQQRACELNGRLRAEPNRIYFEVAESTCSVQSVGTTLVRDVLDQRPRDFTVSSPEGDLTVHYRRVD